MSDELEARAQLLNTTIGRLNTDEALELITLTLREERRRVWEEAVQAIDLRVRQYRDTRDVKREVRDIQINEAEGCRDWCRQQAQEEEP